MADIPLRIAIVADIHHNPVDAFPKICSSAIPLAQRVLDFCRREGISHLVDLGDRIDDNGRDADLDLAKQIGSAFRLAPIDREHLMGNHDSYSLSPEEWEDILDRPLPSHSRIVGGYRLLFFNSDVNNGRGARDYELQDAELDWLQRELEGDERDTVIFTHVPLMAGNMAGHYYFENKPGRCAFANSSRGRSIVEHTGNVLLVVSGHVHWNSWSCCNGVHYATVQSLTESFTTGGKPAGAFAVLQIGATVDLRVFGADPMSLTLPRRRPGTSWEKP